MLAHYGYALAVSGDRAGARKIEQLLRERQKTEFVEADNLAILYYGMGDLDRCFVERERAFRDRSPGVRYIRVDPRYRDDFRSDRRYAELIRKIGFEG